MRVTFTNVTVTVEAEDARHAYALLDIAIGEMEGLVEWSSGNYTEEGSEEERDTGELT